MKNLTRWRVLVLGGTGNFGRRIVDRLRPIDSVRVIAAGRRPRPPGFTGSYRRIDGDRADLAAVLRALRVDVLIAATGPFTPGDYRLARAAIRAGAHYLDLSDCRAHVSGITRLDHAARRAGVLVSAGASSVPALSSAVVDHLRNGPAAVSPATAVGFATIDQIEHGISASERSPGPAAIRAVLACCGRRIRSLATPGRVYGWQDVSIKRFGGRLGSRVLARCDVPDLDLFPRRYGCPRVIFRGGVASPLNMLGLWLLSWGVRSRLIRSAVPLAPVLGWLARPGERFGSGRSAMYVRLEGRDAEGRPLAREWQLVARRNHGPAVPALAAVALVRKLAGGWQPPAGAAPCVGLLSLAEYAYEFRGLDIRHGEVSPSVDASAAAAGLSPPR